MGLIQTNTNTYTTLFLIICSTFLIGYAQNCFHFSCAECTASSDCGWCPGSSTPCMPGNEAGPSGGMCSNWLFSDCPELPSCGTLRDCSSCVARSYCGWCQNSCFNGDENGPVASLLNCTVPDWQFFACKGQSCAAARSCSECTSVGCVWNLEAASGSSGCADSAPPGSSSWVSMCPASEAGIESITFDKNRVQLHVAFNVATDEGVNADTSLQRYSCATYFLEESEFGEGPLCYWNSPWELIVRLGDNPSLQFGAVLTLIPGVVRALRTLDPIDDFAAIQRTTSPVVAAIAGPNRVSSCSNQDIQYAEQTVFGGGPDGFTLAWTASVPHVIRERILVIEGGHSGETSFTVGLTMTNFLGESDTAQLQVTVVNGEVPLVGLFGPTQVSRGESFVLAGNVTDSTGPCFPTTNKTNVVFSWSVQTQPPCASGNVDSPLVSSLAWVVAPDYFVAGCDYIVSIRASKESGDQGSASILITVDNAFSVSIASGTSRVVGNQVLASTAIINQDVAQTSFSWTCLSLTNTDSCSVVGSPALSTFQLDTTQMTAGLYQITLEATFNGRTQVARQFIRVTDVTGEAIVLQTTTESILEALVERRSLPVSAQHTASGTFQWNVNTPFLPGEAAQFVGSTQESCATLQPIGSTPAVTEVDVAVIGTDSGVETSATSRVVFANDPYSGFFFNQKFTGNAYIPIFRLEALSFTSAQAPLSYAIFYFLPSVGERLLFPPSPYPIIDVRLPIGNQNNENLVQTSARVFNAAGGFTDVGTVLRADPRGLAAEDVSESLTAYAEAAEISGDVGSLVSSITLRADALTRSQTLIGPLPNQGEFALQTLKHFGTIDLTHQLLQQWSADILGDLEAFLTFNPKGSIAALAALASVDTVGRYDEIIFSSFGNVLGAPSVQSEDVQIGIDAVLGNIIVAQTSSCQSPSSPPGSLVHPNLNATIIRTVLPVSTDVVESFGSLEITIPQSVYGAFEENNDVVWLAGLVYTSSPFPAANIEPLADQVSVAFYDNNGKNLPVEDAPDLILFDFGIPANTMVGPDQEIKCQFYDRATMEWSENGCQTLTVDNNLICGCNHLTEIGINAVSPPVPMPPTAPPTTIVPTQGPPSDNPTAPLAPTAPTVAPTANGTVVPEDGDDPTTVEIIALVLLALMCLLIFIILIGLLFLYCKVRRFKKRTAKPIDDAHENNSLIAKQPTPGVEEGPIKIAQSSDSRIVKPVFNTNDESSTEGQSLTRTSSEPSQSRPSDSYRTTTSDEDVSQYTESYPRSSSDFSDFVESDSSPSWSHTSGIESSGGKPRTRYSDESEAYFTPGFDGSSEDRYTLSGMSGLSFSSQSRPSESLTDIDSMVDHTTDYFPEDGESGSGPAKVRGNTKGSTDDNPFVAKYRKEAEPMASSSTSRKQFADGLPNEREERSTDDDSESDTISSSQTPISERMSRDESSEFTGSSIDEISSSSFTSSGKVQVPATIITPPPGGADDYESYTDSGTSSDQVSSEDLEEYSSENSESPSGSYSNSTNDRQTGSDEYSASYSE